MAYFTLFYHPLGRILETPVVAVPVTCDLVSYFDCLYECTGPCWLDILKFFGCLIFAILYLVCLFVCAVSLIVAWILSLVLMSPIILMICIGYCVAYTLHTASCGLLFRFEEFSEHSLCLGCCGLTVDKGGLEGLGFPSGRSALQILMENWSLDTGPKVRGGGGGGGGGDGGGGDGGGGDGG